MMKVKINSKKGLKTSLSVLVDKKTIEKKLEGNLTYILNNIGIVFQQHTLDFDLSVKKNLIFYADVHGMDKSVSLKRIKDLLKRFELDKFENYKARNLSGGMKRRLEIARALLKEPKILILDEPTSLLDPKTAAEFMELINSLCREKGMSIIIVEHRLDLVLKYADKLIVLSEGKIISDDTPENVFNYKKDIIPELSVPFSTKLYRKLAKNNMKFTKAVTGVEDMIREVMK